GLHAYRKGGCPVSAVMRTDDARKGNSTCTGWNDTLLEQLAEQRYDVVVTTAVSGKRYEAEPGRTGDESAVDGLVAQWGRIQDLGTTVVAIRDNPTPGFSATQCISESGSTRPPDEGPCSAPRADALLFDPQEAASERAGGPLIDLTDRF